MKVSNNLTTLLYPIKNTLLYQLTKPEFSRLTPSLKIVELQTSTVLNASCNDTKYAYFPIDSIVSIFKVDKNGNANQIAMIGNEGMVGTSLLANRPEVFTAMVQNKGLALRISSYHLANEFQRHGVLFNKVFEYLHSLIAQIGQTAFCSRIHSIEQQLCRWLLLTLDRSPNNQIRMTQEGIGLCLGVRRESITDAAGKLHRLGAISYSRGHINVTNRRKLEMLSCECYTPNNSVYCEDSFLLKKA